MSVGQTLATARKHAALSVEQVSDRTRIRRTLIIAIEQDDFSRCGGDFYARGHVKAIATAVGIDAGPLLAEIDAEEAGVPKPNSASAIFEAERVSRRERRSPNWSAMMAAALVAVVAIAGWQIVSSAGEARSTETVAGGSIATARVPTASPGADPSSGPGVTGAGPGTPQPAGVTGPAMAPPGPAVSPTAVPPAAAPPEAAPPGVVAAAPRTTVELAVAAATAPSWISVSDSTDTTVFAGTIALGQVLTYRDPQRLRLVMGNAGGLSLTVNGVLVGAPGAPGQVVRQEFGLADPVRS